MGVRALQSPVTTIFRHVSHCEKFAEFLLALLYFGVEARQALKSSFASRDLASGHSMFETRGPAGGLLVGVARVGAIKQQTRAVTRRQVRVGRHDNRLWRYDVLHHHSGDCLPPMLREVMRRALCLPGISVPPKFEGYHVETNGHADRPLCLPEGVRRQSCRSRFELDSVVSPAAEAFHDRLVGGVRRGLRSLFVCCASRC